ncbi:MAG: LamG domain-containing protein, partial [Planctomycetaceae bacterium]|nr:LamG domain-containing protein [Planctomycetaceae bacterium]
MILRQRAASWALRVLGLLVAVAGLRPAESSARALFQAPPLLVHVPNLAGYWCVDGPLPDTATGAKDSSGNGNHGTYTGGATTMASAPTVPASNTKSFALTQSGRQYLSIPDSPSLSITGSMTVAAWIRPTLDSTLQEGIVEKWDEPGVTGGYMFRLDAHENLSFSICSAAGPNEVSTSPRAVPLNVWTHVAGVYSQTAQTITNYVNASADPSVGTGVAPPTDGSNVLQIGKDYGDNAFNGNLDEVRIYNKALTAPEVAILKNGQPAPTGLVATPGTNEVQLSWTPPANAATVAVQYSVLRGPSAGAYDTIFNDVP